MTIVHLSLRVKPGVGHIGNVHINSVWVYVAPTLLVSPVDVTTHACELFLVETRIEFIKYPPAVPFPRATSAHVKTSVCQLVYVLNMLGISSFEIFAG